MPERRSIASAADDTSITTCVTPASFIAANVSCRTCGVGVVYGASWLLPAQRYETVPITPGLWPALWRMLARRSVWVVLRFVPVIPMSFMLFAGSPSERATSQPRARAGDD